MSLSTGATLITLSLLMNKLSGLYGILALLTGYNLSSLQLSMYIYSIGALTLTVYLAPHIRTQTPLQCLALAWFYVLDSVINAAYTGVFAMTWFLVLMQHNAGAAQGDKKGPGAGTIDNTSGFTNPEVNASHVEVVAPSPDKGSVQDAVKAVPATSAAGSDGTGSVAGAVLSTESMNSIGIIIALWTVRLYFCVIMLGWARVVVRKHIASQNAAKASTNYTAASKDATMSENPFDESKPEGQGYGGKLGRFLISIGRSYWLGKDEDDSWMYGTGMKFRRNPEAGTMLNSLEPFQHGPAERERRRRSGTGPPVPATVPEVQGDSKTLQVPPSNV
jgi:inositol phosphorylceramide synthase regulatory subunit